MSRQADRTAYITGLRALADILEQQPAIPLPWPGDGGAMSMTFLHDGTEADAASKRKAAFLAAGSFPVQWESQGYGSEGGPRYTAACGRLHGLLISLDRYQDGTCKSCGALNPGHALTCPLIPAGPEHPAGALADADELRVPEGAL